MTDNPDVLEALRHQLLGGRVGLAIDAHVDQRWHDDYLRNRLKQVPTAHAVVGKRMRNVAPLLLLSGIIYSIFNCQ